MHDTKTIITDALVHLNAAVSESDWPAVQSEVTIIATELAAALMHRRDADIDAAKVVIGKFAETFRAGQASNAPTTPQLVAGQLHAFSALLHVASQKRQKPNAQALTKDHLIQKILGALDKAPNGLSGQDLATAAGCALETISRKLPTLAAAGLTTSRKRGRQTVTFLQPAAQRYVRPATLPATPADAAAPKPAVKPHDPVKPKAAAKAVAKQPSYGLREVRAFRISLDKIDGLPGNDNHIARQRRAAAKAGAATGRTGKCVVTSGERKQKNFGYEVFSIRDVFRVNPYAAKQLAKNNKKPRAWQATFNNPGPAPAKPGRRSSRHSHK